MEFFVRRGEATRQSAGRIKRAWRVAVGLIERCLSPRVIIIATVLLVLISWIYPPWFRYERSRKIFGTPNVSHGWFFVFDTKQREGGDERIVMSIDFERLLLIDGILAVGGGLLAYALTRHPRARLVVARTAFGTFCVACLLVMISVGVTAIVRQTQRSMALREAKRCLSRYAE
jgi:hypothetical protein